MPVDQLRAHQREPPRLRRQLPGVRLGAHPGRLIATGPGDHEAARQQAVTGPLVHRLGLTGQQRLVGLQARAGPHDPVRDQLVAGPQVDQVVGDQVAGGDLALRAVADHPDPGRAEHGEPVKRPLGAQLLHDADQRVGDQHDAEQGVLRLADDQDHRQQHAQEQVEPGQDVRAQDLGHRAAGRAPRPRSSARASAARPPGRCSSRPAVSALSAPARWRRPHQPCLITPSQRRQLTERSSRLAVTSSIGAKSRVHRQGPYTRRNGGDATCAHDAPFTSLRPLCLHRRRYLQTIFTEATIGCEALAAQIEAFWGST